jgi:hypothetical protein
MEGEAIARGAELLIHALVLLLNFIGFLACCRIFSGDLTVRARARSYAEELDF